MPANLTGMEVSGATCPVMRTAAVIGTRWTALILRDLFRHPSRRFQDFQTSLAGIAPSTLTERLKMLEREGIVAREAYQEHPPRAAYRLTEKGRDLGPVLLAMRDWGRKYAAAPGPDSMAPPSAPQRDPADQQANDPETWP